MHAMVSHDTCKVQLTHATDGLSTRAIEEILIPTKLLHHSLGQVVLDHIVEDHRYIGSPQYLFSLNTWGHVQLPYVFPVIWILFNLLCY